jgi:hypothetical protein
MPTLKEVRTQFKEYAPSKYRGTRKEALRQLIEATYRGAAHTDADVTGRKFTIKMANLCRVLDVQQQQAMRNIRGLDEVEVIEHRDGKLTYRLDLKPLEAAEPAKARLARINQQRTEKARQKKAAQRAVKRRERILAEMQQFFRELPEENRLRAEAMLAKAEAEAL